MKWHWVYRDFVLASIKSQDPSEWFREIHQSYIQAHERLLNEIHFTPKGFPTKDEVQKRLECLGYKRFEKLLNAIGNDVEGFEKRLISIANNLLGKLGYTGDDQDIYVIV
ncbi:hypothetical protein [Alicyclobacillus sacchari]|uniref:hypothetical protein n=1 Tax=Alicyclobacillus sacchari TaxID=392010 RepID=UPI001065634D|nr:hypothetical protein [Alicyclobacillus sacchari]